MPFRRSGSPPVSRIFVDAESHQNASHPQVVVEWEFGVGGAIRSRAAIDATVVTSIGDGDSQVVNGAAEFVGQGQAVRRPILALRQIASFGRGATQGRHISCWIPPRPERNTRAGEDSASVSFPSTGGAGVSTGTLGKSKPVFGPPSLAQAATTSDQAEWVGNSRYYMPLMAPLARCEVASSLESRASSCLVPTIEIRVRCVSLLQPDF